MDTDDLYPTELELIYSSLTVLMCEEKDVERRIAVNNNDIKNRVKDIVIPMYDVSACPTSDVGHQNGAADVHPTCSDSNPTSPCTDDTSPELETSDVETNPIVKKLFKQIALLCHPDKVKNDKLNRLFIHARSAHDRNDVLTLLFILSKCGPSAVLETSEIAAVKELLEDRRKEVLKKKDTVCYKWDTYTTQIKDILIQQIIGTKR
jgi:hypothetical protein